jgi:hypothetical protein
LDNEGEGKGIFTAWKEDDCDDQTDTIDLHRGTVSTNIDEYWRAELIDLNTKHLTSPGRHCGCAWDLMRDVFALGDIHELAIVLFPNFSDMMMFYIRILVHSYICLMIGWYSGRPGNSKIQGIKRDKERVRERNVHNIHGR